MGAELSQRCLEFIEQAHDMENGPEIHMLFIAEMLNLSQAIDVDVVETGHPVRSRLDAMDELDPHELKNHFGMHPAQLCGPVESDPQVGIISDYHDGMAGSEHGPIVAFVAPMGMAEPAERSYANPVGGVGRAHS